MTDPWFTLAAVEAAIIGTYAVAPVVASARDAVSSMGEAVEQDVQAGD